MRARNTLEKEKANYVKITWNFTSSTAGTSQQASELANKKICKAPNYNDIWGWALAQR